MDAHAMMGYFNSFLYVIAAALGARALWAAKDRSGLAAITFITTTNCAYVALIYFVYILERHYEEIASQDLRWAFYHFLNALGLSGFHLWTIYRHRIA